MIESIELRNFKSFDRAQVKLSPLTVLVGANAAGKSNFIDAFRFIQECVREDVSVAIRRRLGSRGVRSKRRYDPFSAFHLVMRPSIQASGLFVEFIRSRDPNYPLDLMAAELFDYTFRFGYADGDAEVVHEEFDASLRKVGSMNEHGETGFVEKEDSDLIHSTFARTRTRVSSQPQVIENFELAAERADTLFLASSMFSTAGSKLAELIKGWSFFDIDPDSARLPRVAEHIAKLAEDGSNLSLILDQLDDDQDKDAKATKQRIEALMQSMVPGFEAWKTERTYDGRTAFRIREVGTRSAFPPELISDGTVALLALLAALVSSSTSDTIFIEEPERGLHPQLLENLADLMRQVSRTTQVIATTHSPDFVRHLDPSEVYMIDKVDRASRVLRASSVAQVHHFLENFSLDQLWMQGYLEGGLPI